MKCTEIHFEGYKRLAKAKCNVSPRLLAFVGQNEAGKSSVLGGLAWLTEEGETALAALEELGLRDVLRGFSLCKQLDGRLHVTFEDPDKPQRDPQPFIAAAQALTAATDRLRLQTEVTDDEDAQDKEGNPASWASLASELLDEPDHQWSETDQEMVIVLADWLNETPPNRKRARDPKAAALIRAAAEIEVAEHPADAGLDLMRKRVPKFVAFAEGGRDLPTDTPIHTVVEARTAIANHLRRFDSTGDGISRLD
ncbi:hypothetical protein G1H11_17645 [Phytoactinopolyspora alkaliphila]|uniref:Uncharacterized protein n=1 Tax=Phytoactinopolyspora alkaliphila TaxID=1783498 RepID=A0A6N9YQA3_9ACTN|nr:hypothetical protein [Phytoactinopolyspora alkaliphila]NED97125.1 hypothetical protein [Phytoactinopolyspora alkaliphila]